MKRRVTLCSEAAFLENAHLPPTSPRLLGPRHWRALRSGAAGVDAVAQGLQRGRLAELSGWWRGLQAALQPRCWGSRGAPPTLGPPPLGASSAVLRLGASSRLARPDLEASSHLAPQSLGASSYLALRLWQRASRSVRPPRSTGSGRVSPGPKSWGDSLTSHPAHVSSQYERTLGLPQLGKESSVLVSSRWSWICLLNQTEFSIFVKMDSILWHVGSFLEGQKK